MGAIVMDDVKVEQNVIIGANAMVPMNMKCKSGNIYAGTPAKVIKSIDEERVKFYIDETANAYIKYSDEYPSFKDWNNK
jgi:carbonic anhydrase/acetyltransferase-like protein (isoleucine patch superfamily)